MTTPMLIALPRGLGVSGVTTWAGRLLNALADRGHPVGLIRHAEDPEHPSIDLALDPGIRVFDLRDLPALDRCAGDLSPFIPRYLNALEALSPGGPVVVSPNLLGDCFGIVAALTQVVPDRLRVVAWQHSDIPYDTGVLAHYEPMIARFVGVSEHIAATLREHIAHRSAHIARIPYGVPVPASLPPRTPIHGRPTPDRPLRLIYTGRLEHPQKRIGALATLSDRLIARGIAHEMLIVGDGPAAREIDEQCATRPSMRRMPPVAPTRVRELLAASDVFVLPSRYEGLSVSMLEALAHGCVPVVCRVRSGSAEAIEHARSGVLAEVEHDDEASAALALSDAVEHALRLGLGRLAGGAWERARDRFSIDAHADRVETLLEQAARDEPRCYPTSRPAAHTGSSMVPPHAARRLREILDTLAGSRIILHGAGRHTVDLAPVLARAPCEIVAIADDDPARWGTRLLGWEIIAPADCASLGVRHVVLSSRLHESAILDRHAIDYRRAGIRVHPLYTLPAEAAA